MSLPRPEQHADSIFAGSSILALPPLERLLWPLWASQPGCSFSAPIAASQSTYRIVSNHLFVCQPHPLDYRVKEGKDNIYSSFYSQRLASFLAHDRCSKTCPEGMSKLSKLSLLYSTACLQYISSSYIFKITCPGGSRSRYRLPRWGRLSGEGASGKGWNAMLCAPWGDCESWAFLHGGWAELQAGWRRIMGRH